MRLVQDGRLALDVPVERYLTRWHLPPSPFDASGVTVRRLLSHMAGLSVPGYPGVDPDQPLPSLEESLSGATDEVEALAIVAPPGAAWRYSGGGFTLLQLLVEEVTGRPFADYMQATVLTPLGMAHSSFEWTPTLQARLAEGHIAAGAPLPDYRYVAEAAAGLYTTAPDLAHWVAAGMAGPHGEPPGRGVLTPASVAQLFSPQAGTAPSYGLGVFTPAAPKGLRFAWHPGFNRGWRAYFAAVPERGDGVVVLTNSETGWALVEQVARVWGDAIGVGPGPTDLPPEES
jgi:CubicO group peptidase (beta-lactamase class C family)